MDTYSGTPLTPNTKSRCPWGESGELMRTYHDTEWGVPLHDDRALFEFLVLESAQAGLSWQTILSKRDRYRSVFDHFDPEKIADYTDKKIQSLMNDPGIIRNRLKISSAVTNARAFIDAADSFGSFDQYLWRFVDGSPVMNSWENPEDVPAYTPLSKALSRDLRQHGFTFIGPTICYSFMQAVGMVNDHLTGCFRHYEVSGIT